MFSRLIEKLETAKSPLALERGRIFNQIRHFHSSLLPSSHPQQSESISSSEPFSRKVLFDFHAEALEKFTIVKMI